MSRGPFEETGPRTPNPWESGTVRKVEGRYVGSDHPGSDDAPLKVGAHSFACDHPRLGRRRRCLGCGRTYNEIALDEG